MRAKPMPDDIKMECIALCKGYKRRCRDYARQYSLLCKVPSKIEELSSPELMKLLAVKAALTNMSPYGERLLSSIADRIPYEYLEIPMGRTQFYAARDDLLREIAVFMGYVKK